MKIIISEFILSEREDYDCRVTTEKGIVYARRRAPATKEMIPLEEKTFYYHCHVRLLYVGY